MRKKERARQKRVNKHIPNKNKSKEDDRVFTLFNNPLTKAAMSALTDEEKERLKIIGEEIYKDIDYQNGKVNSPPMEEAAAYIYSQINSGMHPSLLDEDEKILMSDAYGDEWYKRWGYVSEDLNTITTLDPTLYIQ